MGKGRRFILDKGLTGLFIKFLLCVCVFRRSKKKKIPRIIEVRCVTCLISIEFRGLSCSLFFVVVVVFVQLYAEDRLHFQTEMHTICIRCVREYCMNVMCMASVVLIYSVLPFSFIRKKKKKESERRDGMREKLKS